MVRLVFCPWRQLKPGTFTHHLPGLVEHAELSQRVEAGVELPGPRADGTGASGTKWAALVSKRWPARKDVLPQVTVRPQQVWQGLPCGGGPGPKKGAEAPWERQAGSTGFGGV